MMIKKKIKKERKLKRKRGKKRKRNYLMIMKIFRKIMNWKKKKKKQEM